MTDTDELLTPSEAAAVAEVSLRDIHRLFEEDILPATFIDASDRRWVRSDACAYVRFYFHAASRLTPHERAHVIHALVAAPTRAGANRWSISDDFLTVDFGRFIEATRGRHQALKRARDMVVEDPGILGGAPVIRGTRIPVHDVAASVKAGVSGERLKAAYSGLTDEQIELAAIYGSANPPRGRPRKRAGPGGLELLSETLVPRRQPA